MDKDPVKPQQQQHQILLILTITSREIEQKNSNDSSTRSGHESSRQKFSAFRVTLPGAKL